MKKGYFGKSSGFCPLYCKFVLASCWLAGLLLGFLILFKSSLGLFCRNVSTEILSTESWKVVSSSMFPFLIWPVVISLKTRCAVYAFAFIRAILCSGVLSNLFGMLPSLPVAFLLISQTLRMSLEYGTARYLIIHGIHRIPYFCFLSALLLLISVFYAFVFPVLGNLRFL